MLAQNHPVEKSSSTNNVILIVDDDATTRTMLSAFVKKLGFRAITLADGSDLTFSCSFFANIKAILMDMNMPKLDGYKATKEIRKIYQHHQDLSHLPIIAVTGVENSEKKCLKAGCDLYVQKPVSLDVLKEAFESLKLI